MSDQTRDRDKSTPIALTIAGSDSGGGAGIQADLKAFSALGVYGASVITAITAQNTRTVSEVHDVPVDMIRAQIDTVLDDLPVSAIKIGMLASPEIIATVAEGIAAFDGPVVLDPVMIAKSGAALLREDAVATLRERLIPRATLLTPNLPEAATLVGADTAREADAALAKRLLGLGPRAVLLKGGHGLGATCVDLLLNGDKPPIEISAPRIETRNTHGTGCTLSAAIAAVLAKGDDLSDAVQAAHAYLHGALLTADQLTIGSGHGPVNHFHALWDR